MVDSITLIGIANAGFTLGTTATASANFRDEESDKVDLLSLICSMVWMLLCVSLSSSTSEMSSNSSHPSSILSVCFETGGDTGEIVVRSQSTILAMIGKAKWKEGVGQLRTRFENQGAVDLIGH